MTTLCRSSRCARHFGGAVAFCPYCGFAQKAVMREVAAPVAQAIGSSDPGLPDRQSNAANEPTPEASAVRELPPAAAAAEELTPIAARPARAWMLPAAVTAAALILMAALSPALRSWSAYNVVPCDGPIDAELSVFVDLAQPVAASTRNEILARLAGQLDAPHKGTRRINLFSTAGQGATPLVSACSAPSLFAGLLGRQGLDAQLRARFMAAADRELAAPRTAYGALSQLLSDASASQYTRSPMNTIVVFSSMNEQTARFSLRECKTAQGTISHYRAARAGGVERPAFKNTSVVLNVVPEMGMGRESVRCREQFWNWYFGDLDGKHAGLSRDYLPSSVLEQ